jgi:hypothetical protein
MFSIKKIAWIVVSIAILGACLWISYIYWAFSLPPEPRTHEIALADLDGDGDLDAFLANGRNEMPEPNTVLLNDGNGNFRDSGQELGNRESHAVELQDFDYDGDIDALVSDIWMGEYFWNDGKGNFQRSRVICFPDTDGYFVGLWRFHSADLNGDDKLDLFLNGCCGGGVSNGPDDWRTINAFNTVWVSSGEELPISTEQRMGLGNSEAVDLGDLDGDGDLDAFVANSVHLDDVGDLTGYDSNEVWLNNENAVFTDSGQRLGGQRSYSVALGDLDGDGDLDAFVGNLGSDEVWLNDGNGIFTHSGQTLGNSRTRFLYLADLDDDGNLDGFVGGDKTSRIWLNDGFGNFEVTDQKFDHSWGHAVALGDVDGNGTVDVVIGKLDSAEVWFNDGTGRMRK